DVIPPRLWVDEGGGKLPGRRPVGPGGPQANPAGRMVLWPAGTAAPALGALVELGHRCEPASGAEPGVGVVGNGDHEDRSSRAAPPWVGDGAQRVRRIRGG